ncbi:unnamed protein product [Cuscuta epithymum]|uniref:Uncharacterized protein n=1 Tax=Cuscuta epithymum TaxID=186058 RepID=A0AAV0FR93_9ASTE|nr:unnamed protein product [Cuscuta epithymum]
MVDLPPALLTPNSFSLIVGFLIRCDELGFEPTTALFTNLFRIGRGSHKNCAGYATLQQLPEKKSFKDLLSSIHGWKAKFVFVKLADGVFFPSQGHNGNFSLHNPPRSAELDAQVEAFLKGGPRSVNTYITEFKIAALGMMRYYIPGDPDCGLWPRISGSFEQADGPLLGIPAEAEGYEMSRKMFMAQAKKQVAKELEAAQRADASKGSGDGSKSQADAVKKAVATKKKRSAEGQQTLTEAGLVPAQGAKKTKPSPPLKDAVMADAQASVQGGAVSDVQIVEDLTLDVASSALVPTKSAAAIKKSARADRDLTSGLYEVTVRYPPKGGLFNEKVSGHDVLFQAIPDADREYLRRQSKDVRLFDGGLDYVVQGAFMLMEQQRRQDEELARLREAEKKAASADEALSQLERLRSETGSLKERADAAEKRAIVAEDEAKRLKIQLDEEAAARRLAEERAVKVEADAAAAADRAVELFMAEGWKDETRRDWSFKVVAERFEAWSQEEAGRARLKEEFEVWYDLGQRRMQMLVYRRLRRRVKNLKPRGIGLPRMMKDPEEELKLPQSERQPPILSSDEEDEPWTESDDYLFRSSAKSKNTEDEQDDADSGAVEGGQGQAV